MYVTLIAIHLQPAGPSQYNTALPCLINTTKGILRHQSSWRPPLRVSAFWTHLVLQSVPRQVQRSGELGEQTVLPAATAGVFLRCDICRLQGKKKTVAIGGNRPPGRQPQSLDRGNHLEQRLWKLQHISLAEPSWLQARTNPASQTTPTIETGGYVRSLNTEIVFPLCFLLRLLRAFVQRKKKKHQKNSPSSHFLMPVN